MDPKDAVWEGGEQDEGISDPLFEDATAAPFWIACSSGWDGSRSFRYSQSRYHEAHHPRCKVTTPAHANSLGDKKAREYIPAWIRP